MFKHMAKRRYQLKKRAEEQRATRRRIVEATVALHREVGPAATSISAIAERAGVQRLTVYRHFPEARELFHACSERNNRDNPPPDPTAWLTLDDPTSRLEAALGELYQYYRRGEQTLAFVLRDARSMPELAAALAPMRDYFESVTGLLAPPWERGGEPHSLLRAALRHALRFETWQSFREQGLDDATAVELMRRFVAAAAPSPPGRPR